GDGRRHLLADRDRNLLANRLRLVDRAVDVLDHGSRNQDLPFTPGAGALVEAAVDADRLAGHIAALDAPFAALAGHLLADRPGHADRLADVAVLGLGNGIANGLAHRLHGRGLDRAAHRIATFPQHRLAHGTANGIGARLHLGPSHRYTNRV